MLRLFGLLFAAMGVVALGFDLWAISHGDIRFRDVGEWWFRLHRDSLQLAQPALERHVSPFLWDPVMLILLTTPAAALGMGLGGMLIALHRFRRGA